MKDKVKIHNKDNKDKKRSSDKSISIALGLILIIILFAVYVLTDGTTQDPYVNDPISPDDVADPYVFIHSIGSDTEDFWSINPADHVLPGGFVSHPSWALADLESRPLLIFTHSEGCAPCVTQTAICESIYADYSSDIKYYDILSGTDEPEATEAFTAYDPNGDPHFVPLTIVVTNGPDDSIIWHSWEGVVQELPLSEWIDDAIAYHEKYS